MRPTRTTPFSVEVARTLAFVLVGSAGAQTEPQELYAPARLLVGVDPSVRPVECTVADLRADPRARAVQRLFQESIWLVELDAPGEELPALDRLRGTEGVSYVERDGLVYLADVPDDPQYGAQWGYPKISAPQAWLIRRFAANVVVAVIDTGVEYTHPDLAANIWTNAGEVAGNGIDDDGNGFVDDIHGYDFVNEDNDPIDDHFHGTHVAGTIGAATDNGLGVAGTCWSVQIMALKFIGWYGYGYTSDAIQCFDYAVANGARLTNNSWLGYSYSQALKNALDLAGNADVLSVCAAGNDTLNNDFTPGYPASYDLPEIVSVAASTPADTLASFSNYGLVAVDLAAPGTSIQSTYLNASYASFGGTSMACPHVAGSMCLIAAHCPLSMTTIKDLVLGAVDVVPALAGLTATGGRLNLERALTQACGVASVYCTPGTTINGCTATISSSGTPSASASSGFTITVNWLEGQRSGLIFYGISEATALPWAPGSTSFMCVKPPTQRTAVQNSGGTLFACNGTLSIDLLAYWHANPSALGQPLTAGQRYDAQGWFRDPTAPKSTNLSNALEFPLVP